MKTLEKLFFFCLKRLENLLKKMKVYKIIREKESEINLGKDKKIKIKMVI